MGVTIEVIAEAIRRAGLKTSYPDVSGLEGWEIGWEVPAYYRAFPRMKPCPVVMLDRWQVEREEDALYLCPCLEKDRSIGVVRYSPVVERGRSRPFTMHFSRYVEGTRNPLNPAGVMLECRRYGVWVGQCQSCMTLYVAHRELS